MTYDHLFPGLETHSVPQLFLPSPTKGPYLVVQIDLDGPFPSFPFLSPILHWIQPGLKPASDAARGGEEVELTAPDVPYVADYHGAGPPPGSGPHRYVTLLFEQPEGFDGKKHGQPASGGKVGISGRVGWGFDRFLEEAGVGRPVAGNWFVSN